MFFLWTTHGKVHEINEKHGTSSFFIEFVHEQIWKSVRNKWNTCFIFFLISDENQRSHVFVLFVFYNLMKVGVRTRSDAFGRASDALGHVRTRSDIFGRAEIVARQWPDSGPTVARQCGEVARQWPDSGPTVARQRPGTVPFITRHYASWRVTTRNYASLRVITRNYAYLFIFIHKNT